MNPGLAHWRGWLPGKTILIEEYAENGSYVVRAELPGLDPAKDVSVMVADGELTIGVDRRAPLTSGLESEFRYGRATRTLPLPRAAKDETATAIYDDGILEVKVELVRPVPIGRTVPVRARR